MLTDLSIVEFSRVLASSSPAPGGGSVAALSGMLGADLIAMVCRLSIGKAGLDAHEPELSATLERSLALSDSLRRRIDSDTEAFNDVVAAFKLPKASDAEKSVRSAAIQDAYKSAIQSPLAIARECVEVLRLTEALLGKSNPTALSDLGVAGQQALAGLHGALMNVAINLPPLKDDGYVAEKRSESRALLQDGSRIATAVQDFVSGELG